ncbi:porin [Solimicrobium silvestre]|uniref:Gram-negative porin n=1 Tax=Solimicrobium silvestre TaxID=2099400 RepID=A0A2S9H5L1_9BURK|nr:porin [Solimicrobium silvestre]PRC95166.1 Gram-negative porin [Solimicrobium silvestre]
MRQSKKTQQSKKYLKWMALASLSAISMTAAAQSSVELFGVLDLGILSESNTSNPALGYLPNPSDKGHLTEMKDGGVTLSYWGIKGGEDLGGGLKANFVLQGNLNAANGTAGGPNSSGSTSLFNQQANVGISGNFGALKAGRVISPIFDAFASTDVRGGTFFGSGLTAVVGLNSATGSFSGASSNASLGALYNDNAIVYSSPVLNGFAASIEVTMGGVAGNSAALRQSAATLTYTSENWKFDGLIYNGNDDGIKAAATPDGTNTNRLVQVGGMYTNGAVSVAAGYFKGSNPSDTGAGMNPALLGGAQTSGNLDMYSVGLGYKVTTALKLTSGYYDLKDQANSGNHAAMFVIGADYALSARTKFYADAASVNNVGSNMNMAPEYGVPVTAGGKGAVSDGITSTAFMLGIRHKF